MLEMKITLSADSELLAALNKLGSIIPGSAPVTPEAPPKGELAKPQTVPPVPVASPVVTESAIPTAAPTATAPATVIPTAAPQYSFDQISIAGAALVDAGKKNELIALLAKYHVRALIELKPEQYPLIATDLRGLGARI